MIDWSDPLTSDGALAGMGCSHQGMGSWLSTFVANNQNTIGKVFSAVAGALIPPPKTPAIAPAAPPPAPVVVQQAAKSPDWMPLAIGGALLLALRK